MLPAICWSATLAMEMSSTSMKAANATIGAMIQRVACGWGVALPGRTRVGRGGADLAVAVSPVALNLPLTALGRTRPHIDRRHDRHAEAQHMLAVRRPVEDDLHWHALHDLDVVPRRV